MSSAGPLVAIVDDDFSVGRSTQRLLRSTGFRAAAFTSAEDFLQSERVRETDCLLLDLRMPGMDGLELQRRLGESHRQIPIIFLSARASDEEERRALRAGAADFLRKPASREKLLTAILAALEPPTHQPGKKSGQSPQTPAAPDAAGINFVPPPPAANEYQPNSKSSPHQKMNATITPRNKIMKRITASPLKTKPLGNSDLWITPVGFGSWAIGGSGWQFAWGKQNDDESAATIHRALELGVNWIDTAAVYGVGHSEEIVARALANWHGPQPYVFTKCGLRWDAQGQTRHDLTAASIRRECEDSLRRLKVEAIDLYQIHWPVEDKNELEEGWSTMAQLQREGKARWIGVSNFNVEQLEWAHAIAPVTSLQPPYSLVRPEVESEVLPFCDQAGIGVIVYSPMASGWLTGAMTRERIAGLPADDWRKRSPEFNEPKLSVNLALVERLRAVGERQGCSPGAVAIAWTLRHPAVTAAIVGARRPEQVGDMVAAAAVQLTESDLTEIEATTELAGRSQ